MVNEATVQKLAEMRLTVMAEAFRAQERDPAFAGLSFEERLGLIVDAEWSRRKSNRLCKLIRDAGFNYPGACVEDIEYHSDRKLDKALITKLSACTYIQEAHNIIILGASGAGKTYMACAFGIAACRNFYKVKYVRLPDLLNDLAVARGEGIYQKVMKQYKKVNLLILDEWLLLPLRETEALPPHHVVQAKGMSTYMSARGNLFARRGVAI